MKESYGEYEGTIIFVSHDRYFVNKVADSLLIFENDGVKYFGGKYDEYLNKKYESEQIEKDNIQNENNIVKPKKENDYFLNKEKIKMQNRIKKIESEISLREEELKSLTEEMEKEEVYSDYIALTNLQEQIKAKNIEIEEFINEWGEINKKLGDN